MNIKKATKKGTKIVSKTLYTAAYIPIGVMVCIGEGLKMAGIGYELVAGTLAYGVEAIAKELGD